MTCYFLLRKLPSPTRHIPAFLSLSLFQSPNISHIHSPSIANASDLAQAVIICWTVTIIANESCLRLTPRQSTLYGCQSHPSRRTNYLQTFSNTLAPARSSPGSSTHARPSVISIYHLRPQPHLLPLTVSFPKHLMLCLCLILESHIIG